VFDAFLGRAPRDWSAEIKTRLRAMNSDGGGSVPPRVLGTTPTIPAERLVGRYHHDYFGDAEVTLRDGRLTLSLLGHAATLEHWHYDTYRPGWSVALVRGAAPLVSFERDGQGRVSALRFERLGEFQRTVSGER